MKKNLFTLAAGLMTAAVLTSTAFAADTWNIDKGHSSIGFTVRHFVAKAGGQFGDFGGTIQFDPKNIAATVVNVEVQAGSIDTNSEKRDGHLKSPDFFDVEKFPTITFVSTAVKPKDETTGVVVGDLTMHGVTKSVELNYEILGVGPDAWGNERAGFELTGKINRKDFGINWNKALDNGGFMLSDDVNVMINVAAVKDKPKEEKKG